MTSGRGAMSRLGASGASPTPPRMTAAGACSPSGGSCTVPRLLLPNHQDLPQRLTGALDDPTPRPGARPPDATLPLACGGRTLRRLSAPSDRGRVGQRAGPSAPDPRGWTAPAALHRPRRVRVRHAIRPDDVQPGEGPACAPVDAGRLG